MTGFDLNAVAERDVITPGMQVRILTGNVLLTVAERDRLVSIAREAEQLREELAGLYAWKRSVDEALNSGDGSYRP